ncbi:hypothetical protein ACFFK0_08685 [Paenibacillus chartarius]|uniref:Nucleotidyltransferase family protein n=1 Tax=Paenibacillus chartarius TaxID=747481 RepID=A0ABV6DIW1_9BACL
MTLQRTLAAVVRALQQAGVTWAVGGSALLERLSLLDGDVRPGDLDIVVALPDTDRALAALSALGTCEKGEPKPPFMTRYYYRFRIDGCDVDMLAGFRVEHEAGVFELPFDESAVEVTEGLPLGMAADWWLLYSLMPSPSRQAKAGKLYRLMEIEPQHFNSHRLRALMEQPWPERLRSQALRLLELAGDS